MRFIDADKVLEDLEDARELYHDYGDYAVAYALRLAIDIVKECVKNENNI